MVAKGKRKNGKWGVVVAGKRKTIKSDGGILEVAIKKDVFAEVGTSRGMTINIGNYESVRVDVWVSLPCERGKEEEAYQEARNFTMQKLLAEEAEIRKVMNERNNNG